MPDASYRGERREQMPLSSMSFHHTQREYLQPKRNPMNKERPEIRSTPITAPQ
jgi:hypothetical protein